MKKGILLTIVCLAMGLMGAGCEDNTIGGKLVDEVKEDDSGKASANISGTWRGISGTGQGDTVVTVRDVDGALSGSLKWWWGGKRNFTGSREGNSIHWVLECDERDDGGGYAVSLSR